MNATDKLINDEIKAIQKQAIADIDNNEDLTLHDALLNNLNNPERQESFSEKIDAAVDAELRKRLGL